MWHFLLGHHAKMLGSWPVGQLLYKHVQVALWIGMVSGHSWCKQLVRTMPRRFPLIFEICLLYWFVNKGVSCTCMSSGVLSKMAWWRKLSYKAIPSILRPSFARWCSSTTQHINSILSCMVGSPLHCLQSIPAMIIASVGGQCLSLLFKKNLKDE